MTIVDCVYNVFGCEVRPIRKDLPTHITESVADHTAMLAKSMHKIKDSAMAQSNQLQDNVTELLDTVSKQKTSINRLQSKLMAMKRQHFQHMFLCLAVVLAIAAIGIGVVSHRGDDKLEDVQDSFASLEVQLQTKFDRKMTDFEKNKTANAEWYSPPFYTHAHGYRMCIRVDANGYGIGKGTHVSVFLYLMPGIFDDDLEWPFQGNVTIELVNRLNPMSNLVREIRFSRTSDPEIVGKVTSRDRAAIGWGLTKFIAHSELVYNADEQTQYLKHDSLIFRISKVKNDLSAKLEHIQELAERNMNSMEGKVQDVQDSFASLEVQLQTLTEIDRKMTDFEKNRTANAPWYSPPFYTHTHGYRMCIRVDVNGYGHGAGTHVSVSLYLMRGMFDDDLVWPFQGDITVELVNQLNPTSNLVEEIHFSLTSDPELVEKVTSGDRAASGWGWHMFIAHSELDYNADKQTQYLKHDSLIFCISKVTNVK